MPPEDRDADGDGADRRDAPGGERQDRGPGPDPEIGRDLFEPDMGPSSAFAHLYRGEIHRMKFWRERLDRTTNWAVTTMAAVLTWAFSDPTHPHYLVLVGGVMVGVFLVVEARRYRGYDIWRSRVRLLQENVFATALSPGDLEDREWRDQLGDDYRTPAVKVSYEEALAHRLRRVYLPLFTVLVVAWGVRVLLVPSQPFPESAAIGALPGLAVAVAVVSGYVVLAGIALRPRTWQGKSELREEDLSAWD
jgi:uncharacterized membrane protein